MNCAQSWRATTTLAGRSWIASKIEPRSVTPKLRLAILLPEGEALEIDEAPGALQTGERRWFEPRQLLEIGLDRTVTWNRSVSVKGT